MRDNNTSRSGPPRPAGEDATILALAATTLRRLADLLTAAATTGPTVDGPHGEATDRAAVDDARQALESVHTTIQDLITRTTAATHGTTHPKLEQALTALRQAAIEAAEAAQLLAQHGTNGGAANQDSTGADSSPA